MKNRLYYIDVIKVLGIYLVILGHLPLTNIIFTKFIFSFHMPLFFFAVDICSERTTISIQI